MIERSGPAWCKRFPGSASLDDLEPAFKANASAFIDAVKAAGAAVLISATHRPAERAYLMHFACKVAGYRDKAQVFHQLPPKDVPPMKGVDIDWTHGGDTGKAIAAAKAMVTAYNIAYPAALVSNHTRRKAIDMTITFAGTIKVKNKAGWEVAVKSDMARQHPDLWPVGASYGVKKLPSDKPHWSSDGH